MIVSLFISLSFSLNTGAQPFSIVKDTILGEFKYPTHKVETKQTWYGISKQYGVTLEKLIAINKDAGVLQTGTVLIIPKPKALAPAEKKKGMFSSLFTKEEDPAQSKKIEAAQNKTFLPEPSRPGFHVVDRGETLYSISKKYNQSIADIIQWNKLESNDLKTGQVLAVSAKTASQSLEVSNLNTVIANKEAGSKTTVGLQERESAVGISALSKNSTTSPVNKAPQSTPEAEPVITPEIVKPLAKEISERGVAAWINDEDVNINKFYALHRTAPVGTLVKVTNLMNQQSVFCKVVGQLPDTGDNNNLIIKLSKGAARKLDVRDAKFQAELDYAIPE